VPYPVAFTTCFAWCLYGTVIGDAWPFVGNILPVLGNAFCTVTALRLCESPRAAALTERLTLGGILVLLILMLVSVSQLVLSDDAVRADIAGYICIGLCIMQFFSPCVEAMRAVRTRDASKISLPLAVTGALCGFFWAIYGLTTGRAAMWIPNGAGFALSATVCVVKVCVGRLAPRGVAGARHSSPKELLLAAASSGSEVVMRSLGPASKADPTLGGNMVDEQLHTTFMWKPCIAADGLVAFRAGSDDAYLSVCRRSSEAPDIESPTDFVIKGVLSAAPGEASCFMLVDGFKKEAQDGATHEYAEDSVALYNPHFKVFIRLNSSGEFDCSNHVNECGGAVKLPVGWLWERFVVSSHYVATTGGTPLAEADRLGELAEEIA